MSSRRLWAYLRPSALGVLRLPSSRRSATRGLWILRPWLLALDHRRLVRASETASCWCQSSYSIAAVGVATGHRHHGRALVSPARGLRGPCSDSVRTCLRQAHRLPLGQVRARRTGDIATHLTSDATVIARVYEDCGLSWYSPRRSDCRPTLAILFAIDWRLGVIALSSLPLHALFATTKLRGTDTVVPAGACRTPLDACRPY